MDKEQIVLLAGVTVCVLSISAFIFWGPSPVNKRKGAIVGLQNLGLTCFLNTLLQSLASCAYFIEWLESCKDQGPVANSLYSVLKVLFSEKSYLPASIEDPLAPTCVIDALQNHGWSLGHGEQDAHELFHLLMASLEEEAHKAVAAESGLPEVLDPPRGDVIAKSDTLDSKQPGTSGDMCDKLHKLDSKLPSAIEDLSNKLDHKQSSTAGDNNDKSYNLKDMEQKNEDSDSLETVLTINGPSGDVAKKINRPHTLLKPGEAITRRVVPKYDCNRNYQPSPFRGLLTSQLECVTCKFKSVLRYDKFDSLSLHLPHERRAGHTLSQLLENYTKPEEVSGVVCDGCNKNGSQPPVTSISRKTLTVGKLPRCLCIHIHRMSIDPISSSPYKRSDFVDFPEYLVMDDFTQNAIAKKQKLKEENPSQESKDICKPISYNNLLNRSWNHLYRLKAVVVHNGTVERGHFVTYRRGPLNSSTRHRSDRWYYTSDETVRDASLAEAMQALAYILFYERYTKTPT